MGLPIEDYALLGDTQTAALVGLDGSIDWLCFPRFDSAACFAKLLGTEEHGRWLLAPAGTARATRRRYRPGTLVLETEFETEDGVVRVVDCMPPRTGDADVVRVVEGVRGRVRMAMQLVIRFGYGQVVPWVRTDHGDLIAIAGPDAVVLRTPVATAGANFTTVAEFDVEAGDRVPFVLTWFPSHDPLPRGINAARAIEDTQGWWEAWSSRCTYRGEWQDAVLRSLIVLKAMTYGPTGGVVAAATTSLPEFIGGVRNWDYRYCWLRDATLSLLSLLSVGYTEEAASFRDWLLRAVAGDASQLQIMYGPAGERRLAEWEVDWLPGYEGSRPVRVGNAASGQVQLDVYGEVFDALHHARRLGLRYHPLAWQLQLKLLDALEARWREPDEGIWEVRGPRQHFTHSKVMAWVAVDRAVQAVELFGREGPVERWRAWRDEIHEEVCRRGYSEELGSFVQAYGSTRLDASLLQIPLVGFLPADDPRVLGTVGAVQRTLVRDGLVLRYETAEGGVDGLPPGEGVFLACSFWLVENLALLGRMEEARALFERLLALRNDVGLLAEEYDPGARRLVGNFPQAFSHIGLIDAAYLLSSRDGERDAPATAPGAMAAGATTAAGEAATTATPSDGGAPGAVAER